MGGPGDDEEDEGGTSEDAPDTDSLSDYSNAIDDVIEQSIYGDDEDED